MRGLLFFILKPLAFSLILPRAETREVLFRASHVARGVICHALLFSVNDNLKMTRYDHIKVTHPC